MKKLEIALATLVLITVVLRVSSVPGSELLSAIAFMFLALFYLLLSMPYFNRVPLSRMFHIAAYGEQRTFRRFWAGASGLVFCIALTGILFELNYWAADSFFWCMGMFLIVPVTAFSLGKHWLQPDPLCQSIALRAGILLLAGIAIVVAKI